MITVVTPVSVSFYPKWKFDLFDLQFLHTPPTTMPGRMKKQAEAAEEDASMQDVNETVANNDTEMQEEAQEAQEVEEEEMEEIEQQRVKIV